MEEILDIIAERIALFVNLVAILAIAVGSIEAAFGIGRAIFRRLSREATVAIWLRYASWLVAALTFSSRPISSTRRSHRPGTTSAILGRWPSSERS